MLYETCTSLLIDSGCQLTPAEVHGMATALLIVNIKTSSQEWLNECFTSPQFINEEYRTNLIKWFETNRILLTQENFEFNLCLPDDGNPLSEQISALIRWCESFLFGLGLTQLLYSKQAKDILKDITEITKLDTQAEGEADEIAFTEIIEYLRSDISTLQDEFKLMQSVN